MAEIELVRGKTALGKVVAAVGTCKPLKKKLKKECQWEGHFCQAFGKSLLKHTIVFMTAGVADSFRVV